MEKAKIKQNLLKDKERLEKQLQYYTDEDPFLSKDRDMTSTLDDDITENEGHDRITAVKNEVVEQLQRVKDALDRLEKGTYGVCKNCGKKISDERLSIMPTAELCMSCELETR